jgi:hypothetical protein
MSTLRVNNIEPTSGNSVTVNSELLIKGPGGDIVIGSTGSSNLSASYAATAGCASNIKISSIVPGDPITSVVLVGDQAVGCQSPFIDAGLTYNAATNLLNTTVTYAQNAQNATFATYTSNVYTTSDDSSPPTSSDFYLTFVDSNNALSAPGPVYTSNNISYNNSQSNLSITGNVTVSGDLRFPNSGSAVVRPIISLIPTGTASFNPNSTNTSTYSNYGINVISTVTSQSYCLRLPQTPTQGKTVTIINKSGMDVIVFPSVVGGDINGIINGYFTIPSDGKSYSFDCYENPLPGGWSVTNVAGINATISTGVINYNYTSSASKIAFVNDSCKISGSSLGSNNTYDGLNLPQYKTFINNTPFGASYIGAQIFSDTVPTQNIWSSIDSIQILTNISYSSCQANFSIMNGSNIDYYYAGTTNLANPYIGYFNPFSGVSASLASFITNVINPWFTSHPGTGVFAGPGTFQPYLMYTSINYPPITAAEVPGTFTPSLQNPYASDNVGDPGTYILNVPNLPMSFAFGPSFKMIGRNYIGTYVHPWDGPLDAYYNFGFGPVLGLYIFDSSFNSVAVPNAKFQASYNVSL